MILISEEKYNRLLQNNIQSSLETLHETPKVKAQKTRVVKTSKKRKAPPPGEPSSKTARRVLNYKRF